MWPATIVREIKFYSQHFSSLMSGYFIVIRIPNDCARATRPTVIIFENFYLFIITFIIIILFLYFFNARSHQRRDIIRRAFFMTAPYNCCRYRCLGGMTIIIVIVIMRLLRCRSAKTRALKRNTECVHFKNDVRNTTINITVSSLQTRQLL